MFLTSVLAANLPLTEVIAFVNSTSPLISALRTLLFFLSLHIWTNLVKLPKPSCDNSPRIRLMDKQASQGESIMLLIMWKSSVKMVEGNHSEYHVISLKYRASTVLEPKWELQMTLIQWQQSKPEFHESNRFKVLFVEAVALMMEHTK